MPRAHRAVQGEPATAVAVHAYRDAVRHDASGGAHCVGHIAVFREYHLAAESARDLTIKHLHRPTHRHHRHYRDHLHPGQAEHTVAGTHGMDQLVLAQMLTYGGIQNGAGAHAHGFAPDVVGVLRGALGRGEFHVAQPAGQLRRHTRCLDRPVGLQAQHVGSIRGGKAAQLHQSLAFE